MRILFSLLVAACGAAGWESAPAALAGRVTDESGGLVSGCEMKLVHRQSGAVSSLVSDGDGRFLARNLPPGTYDITAESPGFARFERHVSELRPGQTSVFDVVLRLSPLLEQVSVTAKAPPGEDAFESRPQNSREVLEMREVRESSAKDVGEALAGLEGLWRVRKGGIASDVVLRGFQQGNVNVVIDGARVHGACPNHMDPSAFHADFAEVETVQVTKGPFDIRNQGSLGGAVNLVTKKPADRFHATPNLGAGSFGFWNPSLTASYSAGGVYGLGGYSFRRSDVYRDGAGRRITDYANYTPQGAGGNAFDVQTGWAKFGASLPRNQSVDFGYTRQQGGVTLYPYLQMDALYDNADRATAGWAIREPGGALREIRLQGYFTRVKHWMTDELRVSSAGAPRAFGMATFASTKALGGRLEAELPGTVVGAEAYRRNWNAVNTMRMSGMYTDQPSMPDVQMVAAGFYAQHRRVFGRLQVTAGARLDAVSDEARSNSLNTAIYYAYHGTRATSTSSLEPSGTGWISYALPRGVELFAGAGSTVRAPDPQEHYFALKRSGSDWAGNPGLPSTRNNEADLGLNVRAGRFSLRPTVFYSRLEDFVALRLKPIVNPTPGIMNTMARSYENVDASVRGGEVSWSVQFHRSLLLAGGVSYTRGIQYAKPGAGMAGGHIAEMPPLKTRASLRYGNRLFFAEVEGRAAGRQDRVDAALRETPTAGYGLLGLRGGLHHRRLNLAVGVDNALNRFYYDHLSFQRDPFRTGTRVPDPGRSVYLNLSLVFE